ncbi:hypothetical protein [uncultured Williamsia sp.]|uniref:hypothetical protein n=1 Tax=uncultured Williamsia sp. TaxID=259311 RepID=UPI0026180B44|nr:hypothetical protein [uncultured Williamsia sp.]
MIAETVLLRAALTAEAGGRWIPAGSDVYVKPSGPSVDFLVEVAGAKEDGRLLHGGGAPMPMDGEVLFDASDLADRLRSGPIHRDYKPSAPTVARHLRP